MTRKKEPAAPISSVGADGEQSGNNDKKIIANEKTQINQQTTAFNGIGANCPDNAGQGLRVISMTELYDTVYPPRMAVIDDFLFSGTYLFVGAPKVGKSFFMGQLAYHVAMGIPLWGYDVHRGTVLYLALEDDYARLQRRLYRMFGVESANNLYFATRAKTVSKGLDRELEGFVGKYPDARLVIIDTLQKVREAGGESYNYSSDYEIVTKLKEFSDKHGICLLVVHHCQ